MYLDLTQVLVQVFPCQVHSKNKNHMYTVFKVVNSQKINYSTAKGIIIDDSMEL